MKEKSKERLMEEDLDQVKGEASDNSLTNSADKKDIPRGGDGDDVIRGGEGSDV